MATTAILRTFHRPAFSSAPLHDRLLRYFGGTDTRRDLQNLSRAQLSDAGIDHAQLRKGPVIEVDATMMNRLMSLR